jgi:hypothetical protein
MAFGSWLGHTLSNTGGGKGAMDQMGGPGLVHKVFSQMRKVRTDNMLQLSVHTNSCSMYYISYGPQFVPYKYHTQTV